MGRRHRFLLNQTQKSYLLLGLFIIGVITVVQVLKPYHFLPETASSPTEALNRIAAPIVGTNRNLESRISSDWKMPL